MTEIPMPPEAIQGEPNLEKANRLVSNLLRLVIKHDNVEKALKEAGFSNEGLVSDLNDFLYRGALTGTGQAEAGIQITTINRFRGLLEPFLPESSELEDDGLKRAKPKSGKDRRGRQWKSEGWNQKD